MELKNKFKINDFVKINLVNQPQEELPDWLKGAEHYEQESEIVIWKIINIIYNKNKQEFYYFVDIKGGKQFKESELIAIENLDSIVNFHQSPPINHNKVYI